MGAVAPVAAAQGPVTLAGNPLSIKADGIGGLQFTNANRGGEGMLFPSGADIANAGLEIVQNGVPHALGGDREPISAPTLTEDASGKHLASVYKVGADLEVTETFTYLDGSLTFLAEYSIKNLSDSQVSLHPGVLADVEAAGSDDGRGFLLSRAGQRIVGGWSPEGALVALEERNGSTWTRYETGPYGDVFSNFEDGALTGSVDPRLVDNGVGVEWPDVTLGQNETDDVSVTWRGGADEEVNTTADSATPAACTTDAGGCMLREAIESASGNGDIVTVPEGDYEMGGPLNVVHDLVVLGGGAQATRVHGTTNGQTLVVGSDASADLRGLTITDGDGGDGEGGGIAAGDGSIVQLADSAVSGNHAWDGAGIYSTGRVDLVRSTLSGNRADHQGGGLFVGGGSAGLLNATVSGNSAANQGGGIFTNADVDLNNVTISGNTATDGGGGIYQDFSGLDRTLAQNTIVGRNTGGSCAGTTVAIQSDAGLSDQASCFAGGDNTVTANPLLGPLAANGGDTETMVPQPGSSAIDGGSSDGEVCPEFDQRGLPRPAGGVCDIGAVEVQGGSLTVVTHVINDGGGHATAEDFTTRVFHGSTQVGSDVGDEFGEFFDLPSGAYRVVASGPAGYTLSYGPTCPGGNVAVQENDEGVCMITANDAGKAPTTATLKVITKVVNDDGGTKAPGDFAVHVRHGAADVAGSPKAGTVAGTSYTVAAGTYVVAPSASGVYTAAIGGSCAASGAVTLAAGTVKTCTVTEDDKPVPKRKFNATTSDGSVTIKVPGSKTFVTLGAGVQIPVGTVVDTRKGRVTLVAAADGKGGTATADFYDGLFKVGQTKGKKPITELKLVEKLSCKKSAKKATIAKKKKKKRRLWGDGHGKFRTKGSFSSATVRGTKWLVQDTCSTTTTKVDRGKVEVRDFVKKKTVFVKAHHKYVAKKKH
jgi:predicted outer membrane repeat protein